MHAQDNSDALNSVPGGVQIHVKVVPGASRDRIVGWLGEALKVAVAAPPEGGKANKALCKRLAKALGIKTQQVQILSGAGSARKRLLLAGVTVEQVRQRLG